MNTGLVASIFLLSIKADVLKRAGIEESGI
jgi:hypothetical protein